MGLIKKVTKDKKNQIFVYIKNLGKRQLFQDIVSPFVFINDIKRDIHKIIRILKKEDTSKIIGYIGEVRNEIINRINKIYKENIRKKIKQNINNVKRKIGEKTRFKRKIGFKRDIKNSIKHNIKKGIKRRIGFKKGIKFKRLKLKKHKK